MSKDQKSRNMGGQQSPIRYFDLTPSVDRSSPPLLDEVEGTEVEIEGEGVARQEEENKGPDPGEESKNLGSRSYDCCGLIGRIFSSRPANRSERIRMTRLSQK